MRRRRRAETLASVRLIVVAVMLVACAAPVLPVSTPGSTPTVEPAPTSPAPPTSPAGAAQLGQMLAQVGPAGAGIDPGVTYQGIARAMNAASAAGSSPDEIEDAVTSSLLEVLALPNGADAIVYSDQFVHGHVALIEVTARTASIRHPRVVPDGWAAEAGVQAAAGSPEVVFYYVNGVLNTESQALASANLIASRLSRHLQRSLTVRQVYNASAASPALAMLDGCVAGAQLDPTAPAADLVAAVCRQAKICASPALIEQTAWDSLKDLVPELILQKFVDPDFASDPVNTKLEGLVRGDINSGKKVVIIGHSQGTLFVRNILGRLTDLPPGNVSGFHIAPAFGKGDDLKTAATRYVLLKGDAITSLSDSTPTDPVPTQQGNALHLHLIGTYLQEGTPSLQVFLDGITDLMKTLGAQGFVNPSLGAVSAMDLVAWRRSPAARTAITAASGDCPAAASPGVPSGSSAVSPQPSGDYSYSVSFADSDGLVSGGFSTSPSADDCNVVKFTSGQGFDWAATVRGPYETGKPYANVDISISEARGYRGPGRYTTGIRATFNTNDPATGYGWGGIARPGGFVVVNDDEKSGSFDLTLLSIKNSPTPISSTLHVTGTFSCASVRQA